MISIGALYIFGGLIFAVFAVLSVRDATNAKRWGNAAFWGLLAASFLVGDRLGDLGNGILVLALVALAGFGLLGRGNPPTTSPKQRAASSEKYGNCLFVPALTVPAIAFIGTLVYNYSPLKDSGLFEARWVTLILLGVGVVVGLAMAVVWFRPALPVPFEEGRRLMDSIGWAAVLPQMLAALGAVFALAGVGDVVGDLARTVLPEGSAIAAVLVYGLGMVAFTMIMGNAFAAFPVMMAAIGIPFLIHDFGGDPAVVGAIGMLSGFCGTLMTPMAANFNIVPAALLELRDQNAVIKAQIGTAIPLLAANLLLLYFLAFR